VCPMESSFFRVQVPLFTQGHPTHPGPEKTSRFKAQLYGGFDFKSALRVVARGSFVSRFYLYHFRLGEVR